ncbi:MAG: hypothetical protein R3F60_24175 [bacterium]
MGPSVERCNGADDDLPAALDDRLAGLGDLRRGCRRRHRQGTVACNSVELVCDAAASASPWHRR